MDDESVQSKPGSVPIVYRGRDQIFDEFENIIESTYSNHSLNPLLLGSTGMGKSSLLTWVANRAGGLAWPILRLSITGDLGQPKGLATALALGVEKLRSEHSVLERARTAAKKIPVRPKTPWFEYVAKVESSATEAVAQSVRHLENLGKDLRVPVLLIVDEAHELSESAASALVNAIVDSEGPVLVVAAGLSSTWDRLAFDTVTAATRIFYPIGVRRLSDIDAISVLKDTAATEGITWPDDLVTSAAKLTHNIPAELQTLGSMLWEAGPNLTLESAQDAMTSYSNLRLRLLKRIFSRMRREAVSVAGKLARLGPDEEGVPLLALREMTQDDESFNEVMNLLERTGLVDIDDDQQVSLTVEPTAFAKFLTPGPISSAPELTAGPDGP